MPVLWHLAVTIPQMLFQLKENECYFSLDFIFLHSVGFPDVADLASEAHSLVLNKIIHSASKTFIENTAIKYKPW